MSRLLLADTLQNQLRQRRAGLLDEMPAPSSGVEGRARNVRRELASHAGVNPGPGHTKNDVRGLSQEASAQRAAACRSGAPASGARTATSTASVMHPQ